MNKYFSVFLYILSIFFLIPGLTQPLMTIEATVSKQDMLNLATETLFPPQNNSNFINNVLHSVAQEIELEGKVKVFQSARSLLEIMNELISHNHLLVGLLIGLFGVIIPVIKISISLLTVFLNSEKNIELLLKTSSWLGKWSMSDVFVMAIIVAFFTINANEQSIDTIQMKAVLGQGFYFFVTYCLLVIAVGQLLERQFCRKNTQPIEERK